MELSCSQRCLRYLQNHPQQWISGGHIERLAVAKSNYKASNVSRRLRELAEANEIERKEENKTVWYRWVRDKRETYEQINRTALQAFDAL